MRTAVVIFLAVGTLWITGSIAAVWSWCREQRKSKAECQARHPVTRSKADAEARDAEWAGVLGAVEGLTAGEAYLLARLVDRLMEGETDDLAAVTSPADIEWRDA